MTRSGSACRACGVPCGDGLCRHCKPAAVLLGPDPEDRLAALGKLPADGRHVALLAAVRGGRLWAGVRAGSTQDIGWRLLSWLSRHQQSRSFARFIAEDSVYGRIAWLALANDDREHMRARAPLWLARGPKGAKTLTGSPKKRRLEDFAALGFRLGCCPLPKDTVEAVKADVPLLTRGTFRRAVRAARTHPDVRPGFTPTEAHLAAAARQRRWPIERIEDDGIVCCTICSECLPASGPCRWCGTDPDKEPPSLVTFADFVDDRLTCPICGLDQTTNVLPVRCACCGAPGARHPPKTRSTRAKTAGAKTGTEARRG